LRMMDSQPLSGSFGKMRKDWKRLNIQERLKKKPIW